MQPKLRNFIRWAALGLIGLAAITMLGIGAIWYLLAASLCENEVMYERVSPNGLLKAVAFNRECGATTGASIHVSVVPRFFGTPSGAGNVFVADYGHGASTGLKLHISWVSGSLLRVEHHPAFRVFKAEPKQYGARIDVLAIHPNG